MAPDRVVLQGEAIAHTNFWMRGNLPPERLKAERDQLEPTGVKFRAVLRAVNDGGQTDCALASTWKSTHLGRAAGR